MGGLNLGENGLLSQGDSAFIKLATSSDTNSPVLSANIIDLNSSSISNIFKITHMSNSVAENGIGSGLLFESEFINAHGTATSSATSTAQIASLLIDASYASPASALTFSTKNNSSNLTEWMRLNENGYLGIGTTTPDAKLTVWGASNGNNALVNYYNSDASNLFTILENGNVGIGSSTPNSLLSIGDNININASGVITGGTWQGAPVGLTYGGLGGNFNSSTGYLYVAGGTTIATSTIYIGNTDLNAGTGLTLSGNTISLDEFTMGTTDTDATLGSIFFAGTGGAMQQDNANLFWDDTNNRLGIGSSSPFYTLTVEGTVGNGILNIASSSGNSYVQIDKNGLTTFTGGVINPRRVGYIQSSNIDNANGIYVVKDYAYVSGKSGISIFNVASSSNPIFIASTSQTWSTISSPRKPVVVGNYAYLPSDGVTTGAVSIFEVSNPAAPMLVGRYPDYVTGATSMIAGAKGIAISGKYLYVVAAGRDTFAALDISDPSDPKMISEYRTNIGDPQNVIVDGSHAYIANCNANALTIMDISDPFNLVRDAHLVDATRLDCLNGIDKKGNYIYGSVWDTGRFTVIDVSNPKNPYIATSTTGPTGTEFTNGNDVVVEGDYAYVIASNKIVIMNIKDPINPRYITEIGIVSAEIFLSGRYLYAVSGSDDSLSIYDIGALEVSNMYAGTINVDTLHVASDAIINTDLYVMGGLNLGENGLLSQGDSAFIKLATSSDTNSPVLSANIIDLNSSSISNIFKITHMSNSVAENGIGSGLLFESEFINAHGTATSSATSTAQIASLLIDASYASPASALTFSTKNNSSNLTEWMRLNENGYLGIGTTTPDAKLTVWGASNGNNALVNYYNSDASNLFTILENGNVGIGSSTPNSLLSIGDNININASGVITGGTWQGAPVGLTYGGLGGNFNSSTGYLYVAGGTTIATSTIYIGNTDLNAGTGLTLSGNTINLDEFTMGTTDTDATLGSIFFAGTGGAMQQDNANLFWDDTNNRLGIGTTTPFYTLTVEGTVGNGILNIASSSGNSYVQIDKNGLTTFTGGVINPRRVGYIQSSNIDNANGIYVVKDYAYVSGKSGISIFNVASSSNPIFIASTSQTWSTISSPRKPVVVGNYAYLPSDGVTTGAVSIFEVSNPAAPMLVGRYPDYVTGATSMIAGAKGIAISGKYLYVVAAGRDTFAALDISDPSDPKMISEYRTNIGDPQNVIVDGSHAYIANCNANALTIMDISDPFNLVRDAHLVDATRLDCLNGIDKKGNDIVVEGDYAYVIASNKIVIMNIKDPINPRYITEIGIVSAEIFLSGRYLYAVSGSDEKY